jgi:NADH-quinone oxidoreductase subunit A
MSHLVLVILIFVAAGLTLLAANLVIGRLVRPDRPSPEKGEVYECGEKPVGSAWVQFDLRFYVVALLFVIFDVELAFFFPWAVVFGSSNQLAKPDLPAPQRLEIVERFSPTTEENSKERRWLLTAAEISKANNGAVEPHSSYTTEARAQGEAAQSLAWIAFADIMVFFGVLLVGFAYLWRRGDLEWVRSTAAQEPTASQPREA